MQTRDGKFFKERDEHRQNNCDGRNLEGRLHRVDQYGRLDGISFSSRALQAVDETEKCTDDAEARQQSWKVFEELSVDTAFKNGLRIKDRLCRHSGAI